MKKIILSLIFCAVSFVVAFSQINITASTTAPEVQFLLAVDGVLQDGRNGTINTIYPGPQQWTTNKSLSFADEAAVMAWAQGYGITFDVEREICFRIRTRVRGCGSYCLSNWSPNARCFDFAAVLFTCDDCVEIALADVLTVGDSVFFNVCAVDETGVCVEVLNTYGIELPIHGVDTILLDAGIYAHVNVDGNAQLFGYTFISPSSSVVTTVVPGPTPGTFQVQQDVDFSSIDVIVDCMDGIPSIGLAGIDTVQLPTPTLSHLDGEILLGQCEEVLSSVPAEVGNIDDDFNFVVIGGDSICVPSCCYTQPYILPQFGVCPVIFPGDTNPKDSIIASGGDGYELANEAGVVIETVPPDGVIADYTFLLPRGIPEGVYTLTITGTPPVGCVTEIDFILFNDCPLLLGGDLAGTGYTNVNGSYVADVNLPPGAEINNTVNTAQIITGIDTAYIAVQDVDDDCASVTVNDSTLLLAKCKDCCPPVDMTVPLITGEEVTDPADILQVQAYVSAHRALNTECQLSGLIFEFDDPGVTVCDYTGGAEFFSGATTLTRILVNGSTINVSQSFSDELAVASLVESTIVSEGFFVGSVTYTNTPSGGQFLIVGSNITTIQIGANTFPAISLNPVNCVLQPGGGTYIYEDVCGTVILTKEPAPEQANEITIDTTDVSCVTITDELTGETAELQRCCPYVANCDPVNLFEFVSNPDSIDRVFFVMDSLQNVMNCKVSTLAYWKCPNDPVTNRVIINNCGPIARISTSAINTITGTTNIAIELKDCIDNQIPVSDGNDVKINVFLEDGTMWEELSGIVGAGNGSWVSSRIIPGESISDYFGGGVISDGLTFSFNKKAWAETNGFVYNAISDNITNLGNISNRTNAQGLILEIFAGGGSGDCNVVSANIDNKDVICKVVSAWSGVNSTRINGGNYVNELATVAGANQRYNLPAESVTFNSIPPINIINPISLFASNPPISDTWLVQINNTDTGNDYNIEWANERINGLTGVTNIQTRLGGAATNGDIQIRGITHAKSEGCDDFTFRTSIASRVFSNYGTNISVLRNEYEITDIGGALITQGNLNPVVVGVAGTATNVNVTFPNRGIYRIKSWLEVNNDGVIRESNDNHLIEINYDY